MQAAMIAEKPGNTAISGHFRAGRTYRGRIKDDHKIDLAFGTCGVLIEDKKSKALSSAVSTGMRAACLFASQKVPAHRVKDGPILLLFGRKASQPIGRVGFRVADGN